MQIVTNLKERFNQIEFWALTSVFSIGLLFFTWQALGSPSSGAGADLEEIFSSWNIQFGYFKHYFIPKVIRYITYFVCFMFLNFKLLPLMIEEGVKWIPLTKIAVGLLIILAVNVSSDFYLHAYLPVSMESDNKALAYIWQSNLIYTLWLSFAFATYTLFKYGGLLVLSYFEWHQPKVAYLHQTPLITWLIIILIGLVLSFFSATEIFLTWMTVIPVFAIFYYLSFYRFLPYALSKKRKKLTYAFLVIGYAILSGFIIAFIIHASSNQEDIAFITAFSTSFFLVIIAAPALWVWYHYQQKQKGSVKVLEQKLGQSTAQLDQLRAQINPHFLFNALNTVYGLAITEKAEQSADAIEKISEMMRFMLRENQEEKISLEKDLDYMKNYMGIQQMRLGSNPNFELSTETPDTISPTLTIAPMLLIPFVENAFKHGISLQSHSFIRLAILLEGNKLIFKLQNSTHDRIWLDDPEKNNHGIGMSNVKQRLALLYPERHLLSVKEDEQSYNVDLTVLL